MPWHKSPGNYTETLGFVEMAAPGEDNLHHLGVCMAVPWALEGLQSLNPQPEPTARNQIPIFFFFWPGNRAQHTLKLSNIPIFFFLPNISKAQGPNPALLRTGLSFSHRGCLEELDESRVCQIKPPKNDTEQQYRGF